VEEQVRRHQIPANDLDKVSIREHMAIFGCQRQKAMQGSFRVPHSDGIGCHTQLQYQDDQRQQSPASNHFESTAHPQFLDATGA
jgi:hypothetical protein